MSDPFVRDPRRLSRLPVPIAGFRKTRALSTFTASPRPESCIPMDEGEDAQRDEESRDDSPAKLVRLSQKAARQKAAKAGPSINSWMTVPCDTSRRFSLAHGRDSMIATPPQRKVMSRKSMAPNPYGMHTDYAMSRRRSIGEAGNKIVVCVRKRPLSSKEARASQDSIVCDASAQTVSIQATRTKLDGLSKYNEEHCFTFDKVFDESAGNEEVYERVLSPLVLHASQGGQSTCFAYGQTGSGKTHTMFHNPFGLCYQAAMELFDLIDDHMGVYMSFYEIYQGQLMDLLRNRRKIVACEKDGVVNILGLEEEQVHCVEDLVAAVQRGLQTRITGSTGANAQSSRSHAVLQYTLRPRKDQVHGRMSFIDLAGSERGADRATVDRLTKLEGSEINKSLLALKECIRAMDLDSTRIPFRQSKLTMVLRDSFLGSSKTCMIATVSPAASNVEHTLNTLRYADRMKDAKGGEGPGETVTLKGGEWPREPVTLKGGEGLREPGALKGSEGLREPGTQANYATELAAFKENVGRSANSSPAATRKLGAAVASSPVVPISELLACRARLNKSLEELNRMVAGCQSQDMLGLLEEELTALKDAFGTLH